VGGIIVIAGNAVEKKKKSKSSKAVPETLVDIGSIVSVYKGQHSEAFDNGSAAPAASDKKSKSKKGKKDKKASASSEERDAAPEEEHYNTADGGENDHIFDLHYQSTEDKLSLTVLYNDASSGWSTLDIMCRSQKEMLSLHDTLLSVMQAQCVYSKLKLHNLDIPLMRNIFVDFTSKLGGKNPDAICMSEFQSICETKLGLTTLGKAEFTKAWQKHCPNKKEGTLSALQCAKVLTVLRSMTGATAQNPLERLWEQIQDHPDEERADSMGTQVITAGQFLQFLRNDQREEKASVRQVKELFSKMNNGSSTSNTLSKGDFMRYLESDANDAFDPVKGWSGRTDMTQSLSNYWVMTSYDSHKPSRGYDGVLSALQRGCRCIEVMVFDNASKEPVVCRSPSEAINPKEYTTFVSMVKKMKIFMRTYASDAALYPIVLSIENHCSMQGQVKVARYLQDVLGSSLYIPKDVIAPLPTPESLKGKVVIKSKLPMSSDGTAVFNDYDDVLANETDGDGALLNSPTFESIGGIDAVDSMVSDAPHRQDELSPEQLWEIANAEAIETREAARTADDRAFRLAVKANEAEELASKLLAKNNMTWQESIDNAFHQLTMTMTSQATSEASGSYDDDDDLARGSMSRKGSHDSGLSQSLGKLKKQVQSAEDVKKAANEALSIALAELQESSICVTDAQRDLESAKHDEQECIGKGDEAAAAARKNRENAEASAKRVLTLQKVLQKCTQQAKGAESVAKTAASECRISEERASEAEKRASNAQNKSRDAKDRAESESKVEELTSQEAIIAKKTYKEAKRAVAEAETRKEEAEAEWDKITAKLEKMNNPPESMVETQRYFTEKANEASGEHVDALSSKLDAQRSLKDAETKAKKQGDKANAARHQADQFSAITEQLVEHAEDEREAAKLRRIAVEKAEVIVKRNDSELASTKAQLTESIKDAKENKRSAAESKAEAEHLADLVNKAKQIRRTKLEALRSKIEAKNEAQEAFDVASDVREQKEDQSREVKTVYAEATEVYYTALREAAERKHKEERTLQAKRTASQARDRAMHIREKARNAKELALATHTKAAEAAAKQNYARQYKEKKELVKPISAKLSKITLLNTTKFKFWEKCLTESYNSMISIPSSKVTSLSVSNQSAWSNFLDFNTNHMTRVFPSDSRKNANPLMPWALGCQMVSTKFGGPAGVEMWLNDGRFRENGSSGYVLKPNLHRDGFKGALCSLKVMVLSGTRLPVPATDSSLSKGGSNIKVKVSMYDMPPGGTKVAINHHTTTSVNGNRLNPVWNEDETGGANFSVHNPGVAMVLFTVWDCPAGKDTKHFVGVSAVPFSGLREGYRSVQLFDKDFTRSGAHAFSSLFVNVSVNNVH
jgi:hypothetical protein